MPIPRALPTLLLFAALLSALAGCRGPFQKEQPLFFGMILAEDPEISQFRESERGTMLRLEQSRTNWGRTSRCLVQASRWGNAPSFTIELDTHRFDLPADTTGLTLRDPAFCDLFGQSLPCRLTTTAGEETGSFTLPPPLRLNLTPGPGDEPPAITPGFTLEWNAAPEPMTDIVIEMRYRPVLNVPLPEAHGRGPYTQRMTWHLRTPDEGAYTFQEKDFPKDLPNGALLSVSISRGSYRLLSVEGEKLLLQGRTSDTGLLRYGGVDAFSEM